MVVNDFSLVRGAMNDLSIVYFVHNLILRGRLIRQLIFSLVSLAGSGECAPLRKKKKKQFLRNLNLIMMRLAGYSKVDSELPVFADTETLRSRLPGNSTI